jgi:biotin-dependent carboxylase-like uncharacterized protein
VIEVLNAGPLTTVQDQGRAGYAALGVPRSGAFDRSAAALANRLVGNPASAALFEVTLGGLELRCVDAVTLAVAGAACGGIDHATPVSVPAGAVVRLGVPARGLRSYLAVRGGVLAEPVLGSRSTDLLSGLGPPRVRAGDEFVVGAQPGDPVSSSDAATVPSLLRVLPGPRLDWFAESAFDQLCLTPWQVRSDSDRVGVRLDGPALVRIERGELPSEATRRGAVQVPPDGLPIILGPDAPVTGGYPVIAILADLDAAAQLRPGDTVLLSP